MDWTSLLALLTSPQVLAFLAPLIASATEKLVAGLPAWAKPVISLLVGIIGTALGGRGVGNVFEGERRFEIVVRLPEELRHDPRLLAELPVPLPRGESDAGRGGAAVGSAIVSVDAIAQAPAAPGFVPLSSVARMETSEGPNEIVHEDGHRAAHGAEDRDVVDAVADVAYAVFRDGPSGEATPEVGHELE